MRRSQALASLSRDHHHALVVAQELRRATEETVAGARRSFLAFWRCEGHRHFRVEEEVLLPGCADRVAPDHPAVVRVLVDHVELRRRADRLAADSAPSAEALRELGDRLQAHVRHEERVLFPLIEAKLPEARLAKLAAAVERAEARPG